MAHVRRTRATYDSRTIGLDEHVEIFLRYRKEPTKSVGETISALLTLWKRIPDPDTRSYMRGPIAAIRQLPSGWPDYARHQLETMIFDGPNGWPDIDFRDFVLTLLARWALDESSPDQPAAEIGREL